MRTIDERIASTQVLKPATPGDPEAWLLIVLESGEFLTASFSKRLNHGPNPVLHSITDWSGQRVRLKIHREDQ